MTRIQEVLVQMHHPSTASVSCPAAAHLVLESVEPTTMVSPVAH